MRQIVGIFSDKNSADSASELLFDAGYKQKKCQLYSLENIANDNSAYPFNNNKKVKETFKFLDNGDVTLKLAINGTIIGAIIVFLFSFLGAWLMVDDLSTRILISGTLWKCGAVIGAFVGIYWAYERGLTPEYNSYYLKNLQVGKILVAVQPKSPHASIVRGILIESGALEVRDLRSTMEVNKKVLSIST